MTNERVRALADELEKHFGPEGWNFARVNRIVAELRALLAQPPADGWVCVPATPTEAMLSAMAECDGYLPGDRDRPGLVRWEDYWRMALSAAPQPPAREPLNQDDLELVGYVNQNDVLMYPDELPHTNLKTNRLRPVYAAKDHGGKA